MRARDVNDALNATCVGVDLVDGRFWWPPAQRLWLLLGAVLDAASCGKASPAAVASFMRMVQWFDLLQRLTLSVFAQRTVSDGKLRIGMS